MLRMRSTPVPLSFDVRRGTALALACAAVLASCAGAESGSGGGGAPLEERATATLLAGSTVRVARVSLPSTANGPVELTDVGSGLSVQVTLVGATGAPAAIANGHVVYARGHESGADVLQRVTLDGAEDQLLFPADCPRQDLRYEVALGTGVAGLRLVADSLELLDDSGAPRLHMHRPYIVTTLGERIDARVEVAGCAVDADPRGPWNRPVTPPGASHCMLRVSWQNGRSGHVALLDPAWTTTAAMAGGRSGASGVWLASIGRALVIGGTSGASGLTTVELYDPVTATWASTSSLGVDRVHHTTTLLSSGRVLVTGGFSPTGEVYDPAAGVWTPTGALSIDAWGRAASLLPSGKVLVVGGCCYRASAEIYDPATNSWSLTSSMSVPRFLASATLLTNGKVLVAGGHDGSSFLSSAELFDEGTQMFAATDSLQSGRMGQQTATLPSGLLLVAGGQSSNVQVATAELYDPSTATWAPTGSMAAAREVFTLDVLPTGKVLAAAGASPGLVVVAELFDPAAGSWSATASIITPRQEHASAVLGSGKVLVAGGWNGQFLSSAELYGDSPDGSPCGSLDECKSSFCVDGVCCDSACGGTCQACTAATKASGPDGRCGPVANGIDPRGACKDDGAPACGLDGTCDGSGACRSYAAPFGCTPRSCAVPQDCASGFCVDGICCQSQCGAPCQACTAIKKGSGIDGVCGVVAADTDPDAECPQDPGFPSSCRSDGLCDGAGACRASAPSGTPCGAISCSAGLLAGSFCSGAGQCVAASTPCDPYACRDATTCGASCSSGAECGPSAYCASGACQTAKVAGVSCASPVECASGFCADGVCCSTACVAACRACAEAVTGGIDGVCSDIPDGADPDGECPDDGAASCQRDGSCDGNGACRQFAKGTPCGVTNCSGNSVGGSLCDGLGACSPTASPVDCTPFLCTSVGCTSSCSGASDCAQSAWCDVGVCKARVLQGEPCALAAECATNFCADGYCCNAPCAGQCEACDVIGGEGTCVPLSGSPHGARAACAAGSPSDPCSQATCDGTERVSCTGHVGSSVACRTAGCANGVAALAAACDGHGACPAIQTKTCEPFVCRGTVCGDVCAVDAECAAGYRCDSAKCVTGVTCDGDHTLRAGNGAITDCSPFKCEGDHCKTSCASVDDCSASNLCDLTHQCVVRAPPSATDPGGCGCRVGDRGRADAAWVVSLGLLLAAWGRRSLRARPMLG